MKTTLNEIPAAHLAPTKADELAILRDAVAKLGPLSYCGPWLAEQLDGISRDLASDFFPQIERSACILACAEMVAAAKSQADEIRTAAARESKAMREKASADIEQHRASVARALREAEHALNR